MKPDKLKNIMDLLLRNKISEQDRDIWLKVCANLGDEEAGHIIEALKVASVEEISFLTKNIKDKIEAIGKNDTEALNKIIISEENFLKES